MRALFAVGARPNFVKVAPLLDAAAAADIDAVLLHTGQHYDRSLSDEMFADLGLRSPDHHLGVGSAPRAAQIARIAEGTRAVVQSEKPDVVVVVGDANSTLACALGAATCDVQVAHVEAGLRSGDWSMPEEVNRVVTDRLASLLFAPSADAVEHLLAEGTPAARVHLVGNVMIDSLLRHREAAVARPLLGVLGVRVGEYGVVTLHRPGNVDDDAVLASLLGILGQVATLGLPLLLPAHPRARAAIERLGVPQGVRLVDPLGYLDFVCLEAGAAYVLTDSGGVQEETTVLGVPCVTLRDTTERPITVTEGTNVVVGRDAGRVRAAVEAAIGAGATAHQPHLWDGRAARRVVAILRGSGPEFTPESLHAPDDPA